MFLDKGIIGGVSVKMMKARVLTRPTDQIQTNLKISQEIPVNWNIFPGFNFFLQTAGLVVYLFNFVKMHAMF